MPERATQVDDPRRVRTLQCNTHKGAGEGRKLTRSHSIFPITYPCGITGFCKELYGSEGLNQVMNALIEYVELLGEYGLEMPLTICYDDGCRLSLYLMRRQHISARAVLLSCVDVCVDKFLFPNHRSVFGRCGVCYGAWRKGACSLGPTGTPTAHKLPHKLQTGTGGARRTPTPTTAWRWTRRTPNRARRRTPGLSPTARFSATHAPRGFPSTCSSSCTCGTCNSTRRQRGRLGAAVARVGLGSEGGGASAAPKKRAGPPRTGRSAWATSVNAQFLVHGALRVNVADALDFLESDPDVVALQEAYVARKDPTRGPGGPNARVAHRVRLRQLFVDRFGRGQNKAGRKEG